MIRTAKPILSKDHRFILDRVHLVPAAQSCFNTAYRVPHDSSPFHVMYGRAPRSTFSTLPFPSGNQWHFDISDKQELRSMSLSWLLPRRTCANAFMQLSQSLALGSVLLEATARFQCSTELILCWLRTLVFLGFLPNRCSDVVRPLVWERRLLIYTRFKTSFQRGFSKLVLIVVVSVRIFS